MRILEVTQTYAPFFEFGGPPTKVRALAEGLAALGNEVTVLTADWGLDKRLLTLPDEVTVIPGHGSRTTIGTERDSNPFLQIQ